MILLVFNFIELCIGFLLFFCGLRRICHIVHFENRCNLPNVILITILSLVFCFLVIRWLVFYFGELDGFSYSFDDYMWVFSEIGYNIFAIITLTNEQRAASRK